MSTDEQLRVMRPFSLRFLHWLGPEKEQGIVARARLTGAHRNLKLVGGLTYVIQSMGSSERLQDPQDPNTGQSVG